MRLKSEKQGENEWENQKNPFEEMKMKKQKEEEGKDEVINKIKKE